MQAVLVQASTVPSFFFLFLLFVFFFVGYLNLLVCFPFIPTATKQISNDEVMIRYEQVISQVIITSIILFTRLNAALAADKQRYQWKVLSN